MSGPSLGSTSATSGHTVSKMPLHIHFLFIELMDKSNFALVTVRPNSLNIVGKRSRGDIPCDRALAHAILLKYVHKDRIICLVCRAEGAI